MTAGERRAVRVVAALIADQSKSGCFLVQQRLPGVRRELLWEFPGGKVEEGESDAQALIRECREELGVDLSVEGRLWMGVHRYEDLTVELVLYRARIVRGMPKALRANELRYLSLQEMRSLRFCEADLPLLDALESGAARRSFG